ncbi:MAG: ATP-binding protein [Hyphomicrobiales bacterium]|nr:MAG: ATP-binding protein [Hyphomicrobiales bacterium]
MIAGLRTIGASDLDALQRLGPSPSFRLSHPASTVPPNARVLFRIDEIGAPFDPHLHSVQRADGGSADAPLPVLAAAVAGLHRAGVNLAFGLEERDRSLRVSLGSWAAGGAAPANSVLLRALRGEFAPVRASRLTPEPLSPALTRWGLLLGLPTLGKGRSEASGGRVDRLIRAMADQPWAISLLAMPVTAEETSRLRLALVEEMRQVESATSAMGAVNRLTTFYLDYLDHHLAEVALGIGTGLWRTAVYLAGTGESYPALAGLLTGSFSGEHAVHAPLRVHENASVQEWASGWMLPDDAGDALAHPYAYQSLLTSARLAALVDLPSIETNGFAIRRSARFDVTRQRRPAPGEPVLALGQIKESGIQAAAYDLSLPALNRHAFITGVTGSGKTNTMFQLLRQLDTAGQPFLVMEPTKNEYRALATEPQFRGRMRVFTVGDERFVPMRLNPFEVVGWPAMPLGVHLDLLRSCFTASFGMWTPLPQILEQSLHEVYRDRGWDALTNSNARLPAGADPSPAWPTLTDLSAKVDVLTGTLGYDERVRNDLRAALLTRVNGLRVGGKGALFDCARSTSMAEVLSGPVVLELQNLGDDDDKAFFMALLFMRLVEHRRATGNPDSSFAHLLVIEEAHRLLANTGASSGGGGEVAEADPRGKAVETFSNLISEVRAYGQGIAVVDQVPTKLAPDVIKNTNIKLVHRIVAEDDRTVLAGAMAMNDEQKTAMAVLPVGEAILFEEGEDAPIQVAIPRAKDMPGQSPPSDEALHGLMPAALIAQSKGENCGGPCRGGAVGCREAAAAANEPLIARSFAKLILSTLFDAEATERLRPELEEAVRVKRPEMSAGLAPCLLRHLSSRLAARWGTRRRWTYPETATFSATLLDMLGEGGGFGPTPAEAAARARIMVAEGARVCTACNVAALRFGDSPICLSRLAVDDLIEEELFANLFAKADEADVADDAPASERLYGVCNSAAYELVEYPAIEHEAAQETISSNARRTLICFGYQMLARTYSRSPWVINGRLDRLVNASQTRGPNAEGLTGDKDLLPNEHN